MPLKLNVGLSRKVGEANYGSRGASVNVELELDASLVNEPGKLQERIRQLFSHVRTSVAEELNGGNGHADPNRGGRQENGHSGDSASANSPSNGSKNSGVRSATQSQVKAIYAISKSQGLNLTQLLRDRFQVGRSDELTIKQASQLIDEMKQGGGS